MKRLIHFQSVGHSSIDPVDGRISPRVFDRGGAGWGALISRTLVPLISRTGKNFDTWLHNPGGIWHDPAVSPDPGAMLFHQFAIARERYPELLDMSSLEAFSNASESDLYGYVGYPLSDRAAPRNFNKRAFDRAHSEVGNMPLYYGPMVKYGFKGIGHDWSANWQVGDPWETNVEWLEKKGLSVFVEAVPLRKSPVLLNFNCIGAEWIWEASEEPGQTKFFREEEILGTSVHLVLNPKGSDPILEDPKYDPVYWRYTTALRLLTEGKHVAVPLSGLRQIPNGLENLVGASL